MVGLDVPVIPVEHQYIVTEPHPAIVERHRQGLPEMGVLREPTRSWYMREEAGGLSSAPTRRERPRCYVDGPDRRANTSSSRRIWTPRAAYRNGDRARAGLRRSRHQEGLQRRDRLHARWQPHRRARAGPANFWLNEGHSFGVTAAGGAGWQLAEWIVDGEPTVDMMGVDPRRFGPYATRGYLRAKNEEAYANVFTPHYPDEERPAARPLKTTPCYERMKELGAVFGSVYGWERPTGSRLRAMRCRRREPNVDDVLLNENHAPQADDGKVKERWSFRRSNSFPFVGEEIRNVTTNVGPQDMSPFAKALVSGPGAESGRERILANRIPKSRGRIALCHLLSANGGTRAEFTVYERAPGQLQSGILLAPGSGIQANLGDKARRLGIPVSEHWQGWRVSAILFQSQRQQTMSALSAEFAFGRPHSPLYFASRRGGGGGANHVRAFAEQITMLGLTMLLGAVGLGAFCRLFYNATIYALPCFVGLFVGFFAESTGAGLSAAITFGVAAGVLLLAIGQKILTLLRSPFLRAIVALTFAALAARLVILLYTISLGSPLRLVFGDKSLRLRALLQLVQPPGSVLPRRQMPTRGIAIRPHSREGPGRAQLFTASSWRLTVFAARRFW